MKAYSVTLQGWIVAGTKLSSLLAAYESMFDNIDKSIDSRQHEATVIAQTYSFENIQGTTTVLPCACYLFKDELSELLSLYTKNIADLSIAQLE